MRGVVTVAGLAVLAVQPLLGVEPIRMARLFSDGAVVQRDAVVPVWGRADPGSAICVRLGAAEAWDGVSDDGKFLVRLPPQGAGGPYELMVSNVTSGAALVVRDVMVGEVWLASGQSNMEFRMRDSPKQLEEFNAVNSDPSLVREFTVAKNASGYSEEDCRGESCWRHSEPGEVDGFSAVACWFARALQRKLGVTVGIVNSSWGGTRIESWTERDALLRNPFSAELVMKSDEVRRYAERWADRKADASAATAGEDHIRLLQRHYRSDMPNEGVGKGWAMPGFDDSGWNVIEMPSNWSYTKAGLGIVWLRKTVEVPAEWAGKDIEISFGGIDKTDITYFNGVEVGHTGTAYDETVWNVPRNYKVPGRLVKAGRNTIAVRNYSFVNDGGWVGSHALFCLKAGDGASVPLAGEWRFDFERSFGNVIPLGHKMIPLGPGNPNTPTILFDGMIKPLLPYALRGIIWYQGCSNAGNVGRSTEYFRQMNEMIDNWRLRFGQGDLPFGIVQLAGFRRLIGYDGNSAWAVLRDSQLKSSETMSRTGLAVTIDVGEAQDIHPKDKRTVGDRLAAWAFKEAYGFEKTVQSPRYLGKRPDGSRLRLRFDDGGAPLELRPGRDGLTGFHVSDDGETYRPARAVIKNGEVVLSSGEVAAPKHVAYCWADCPLAFSLYNAAGMPASPFRD